MTFLVDTDLLSLLERKRVPISLLNWFNENEENIFLSVVSLAEIEFGIGKAPAQHQKPLFDWLSQVRTQFSSSTDELSVPVLIRWKELLTDLKRANRRMTCEDSLIAATALYHGHIVVTGNLKHFEPAGVPTLNPVEK
jgi:predicted nucleic acid-binding protein